MQGSTSELTSHSWVTQVSMTDAFCPPLQHLHLMLSILERVPPWDGIDDLDAMIQMFNSISALRKTLRPKTTESGIISEGGKYSSIIPWLLPLSRSEANFQRSYQGSIFCSCDDWRETERIENQVAEHRGKRGLGCRMSKQNYEQMAVQRYSPLKSGLSSSETWGPIFPFPFVMRNMRLSLGSNFPLVKIRCQ